MIIGFPSIPLINYCSGNDPHPRTVARKTGCRLTASNPARTHLIHRRREIDRKSLVSSAPARARGLAPGLAEQEAHGIAKRGEG